MAPSTKYFKKFIIPVLIFFLISAENKIWSQNWPSLFEPQDFMAVPKKSVSQKSPDNSHESEEEQVRKKLYNSFYFVFDFISETRGERPRGWLDPVRDPQKALELGYPQVIKRPTNEVHFPVYPLVKLHYFKGDSLANSVINVCQTYWLQNLYQESYNCFASLQMNIEDGTYPTTPLLKMQINLLQGFFMLNLLINNEKDVKNISFSTIPPTLIRFKPGEMLSITNSIFYYVATHYKESMYIPEKISNDIVSNYGDFYENPVYFIKNNFKTDKKRYVTLSEESLDVLTWIRSVMPMVYLNVIGLSGPKESQQRGFIVIDKLENYFQAFNFPKQGLGSAIQVPELSTVSEEIFLKPLNNLDALVMGNLYKSLVLQKAQEPDTALKFISKGILKNGDPNLASLLFKISGDAYFDLNILQLARRSYSWSEMYSKNFAYKVPSALFFGAESAFWLGQYDTAKSGFKRFLFASGDKVYAPQAMLRIANIEQLQGNDKNAQTMYGNIVRNLDKHPVSEDASVNLFCMNINHLTPNVRKQEYKKVEEKIKFARVDLKRQAKACLMSSDLIDATQSSFKDKSKNVVEKAQVQKDIIHKYSKEFPTNEFIVLFADRIKQLDLSEAAFLAWQDKCKDLIVYYGQNKKKLNLLSKKNNKYVAGLKWDKTERKKLLRCSALLSDFKLWNEARHFDVGKDGNPMQDKFYTLSTKPSSYAALKLYFELKKSANKWETKLNKVENSGTEITNSDDFWELLALHKFLNYEFAADKATRALLSHAIVKDLMKDPKLIFELPIFCSWFLNDFSKLESNDLDIVAKIKSSKEWTDLLLPSAKGSQCEITVAQNLLSKSYKMPSDVRDKLILLPYLEKQGAAGASEDWLVYAQRLEQERGRNDKDVIDIYKNLDKKAGDSHVKSAASLWLKKNFPQDADKVLW